MSILKSLLIRALPESAIERLKEFVLKKTCREFRKTGSLSAYPTFAVIDPANMCNLSCPCCPTGTRQLMQPPALMTEEDFKRIIDAIPTLKGVALFNWGEPFLNKQIFTMIAYAAERGIEVTIHSNFSIRRDPSFFEKIVRSGLATLVISLDGASPESYSQYRRNGDFSQVLRNIRQLVNARIQSNSSMRIVWKFVINRFNEDEIEAARREAKNLGIEFTTSLMGLGDDLPDCRFEGDMESRKKEWLPRNKSHVQSRYRGSFDTPFQTGPCQELFSSLTIGPTGDVYPCCYVTKQCNAFGNILRQPLSEIWNNSYYTAARNLYVARESDSRTDLVCRSCRIYTKDVTVPRKKEKGKGEGNEER